MFFGAKVGTRFVFVLHSHIYQTFLQKTHQISQFYVQCSFLELEPQARLVFQFDTEEEVVGSPAHNVSALQLVDMLEVAVDLLDPDMDPVRADIRNLGRRHAAFGVCPRHLFSMEKAVTYMLEEMLEDDFKTKERRSWETVFQFLIKLMQEGIENPKREQTESCYF